MGSFGVCLFFFGVGCLALGITRGGVVIELFAESWHVFVSSIKGPTQNQRVSGSDFVK